MKYSVKNIHYQVISIEEICLKLAEVIRSSYTIAVLYQKQIFLHAVAISHNL